MDVKFWLHNPKILFLEQAIRSLAYSYELQ